MLLGVADGLLTQMGAEFKPFERRLHDATEEHARELCGPVVYAEARERGASMPLTAALALALGPA
jgi:hypothetical protein